MKSLAFVIPAALVVLAAWIWWGWRIEPENGQIAVLMKKTGKDLPLEAILSPCRKAATSAIRGRGSGSTSARWTSPQGSSASS